MTNEKICFVSGRSGGHIIPCLTEAKRFFEQNYDILLLSTKTQIDKTVLENSSFNNIQFNLENFPYLKLWNYPKYIWNFGETFLNARKILKQEKPIKIVSMGGYISIPICLAAKTLGIPIELFELNAVPGRTIKLLAPMADKILVCFENCKKYFPEKKGLVTNYPLRYGPEELIFNKEEIINNLNFSSKKKIIFILGGSQGSIFINNIIKKLITENPEILEEIQLIHQTGSNDKTNWQAFYENLNVIHFPYSNNIKAYYKIADLIICRSGAGTIFEIKFFDKKCITIPLEGVANSHQLLNANAIQQTAPKFTVLRQKEIEENPEIFYKTITTKLKEYEH